MSKRLKRFLGIYILGAVLVSICSMLYFFYKSNTVFASIFVVTFIISYLMPLWFRLFLKTKTCHGKYRKQLLDFAKLHGFTLKDIYIRESNRSNACSFGLFNNKVVTFNSLTMEKHPYEEIEGVMAHELGHHANLGIYIYTSIVGVLLISLSLVNVGLLSYFGESPIYLLLICLITSALILPFVLMISRFMEHQADLYAVKILKDPSSLGRFLERMLKFEEQTGDKWPKSPSPILRFFLFHPWIYDRITLSKRTKIKL